MSEGCSPCPDCAPWIAALTAECERLRGIGYADCPCCGAPMSAEDLVKHLQLPQWHIDMKSKLARAQAFIVAVRELARTNIAADTYARLLALEREHAQAIEELK